jgi:hypothetical protein
MKPVLALAGSFVVGALAASAVWSTRPQKAERPPPVVTPEPVSGDDESLRKANATLTSQLHECDRRLAELGERPVGLPVASAAPSSSSEGGRGRRERPSMTKEDWERMANAGMVPVRIPCIRDKTWTPSEQVVARLGLAPADVDVIKAAYEASNKRVTEQVKPLCAQALGSADAAEKVGVAGCIDVIQSTARKTNPDAAKAALSRVAEVQAGKRVAPPERDLPPIEQLALALTKESSRFEDDLAQKLGPDEAKRIASAPEMCAERTMLRAGEIDVGSFVRARARGR